ncbi:MULTISPECIES: MBOAT family protein [unclassified Wenzhouxiangella]|uniref:MBOAT family O-acyltransferase n=1 Tax=unclassified Wenzhouxiangella TaxID=2613841 RepID=UPI000E32B7B0|nr:MULTISPECIES: MBOAT family protein [unclassified Wenzhouxiangella]RFF28494.1 MBOAT family protein [Wenzhouxiangella sp. 15181]RFP70012.1 MBOAT family protein [Wenzhouxiangella sp. 15190]
MTFDSLTFALFIVALWGLVGLSRGWRVRKLELLAASYLFYAAWNPVFIWLLVVSTVVDWNAAKRLHASENPHRRKAWLLLSVVVNLGLLSWFKYADFFIANYNQFASWLGLAAFQAPLIDVVLPIGISFYTFQTLSYTFDVYRRRITPGDDFADYALYVSFFPQLVAGPIVRYEQFAGQLASPRHMTAANLETGTALMVAGLFLKTVLADSLFAPVVDSGFAAADSIGTLAAWSSITAFSGQIYCDFAGYSLCAIGAARVFGFVLPKNFHAPYAAVGFSDFWRRWHITLSTWIRDYLYISLGGSHHGRARTLGNLIVAMGLGGLWHGAAWTFVLWGLAHGLWLVIEHALRPLGNHLTWLGNRLMQPVWMAVTFVVVTLTWVLFRAENLPQAGAFYRALLTASESAMTTAGWLALAAMAGLLAWHVAIRRIEIEGVYTRLAVPARGVMIGLLLTAVLLSPGENRAFIYFQF